MDEISENILDEELKKLLYAKYQRLQLLEAIHWTEIMELWIHLCSRLVMKDHIKNAMQEVAEKLENWKDAAIKRKY